MKTTKQFIQMPMELASSTKLTSSQKLFISYILGWQQSGKVCYESNDSLASKIGLKKAGIRKILLTLNKYDFFKSTQYGVTPAKGEYTSTHTITIDEDKLDLFLSDDVIEENETPAASIPVIKDEPKETPAIKSEVIELNENNYQLNEEKVKPAVVSKKYKPEQLTVDDIHNAYPTKIRLQIKTALKAFKQMTGSDVAYLDNDLLVEYLNTDIDKLIKIESSHGEEISL